MIVTALQMCLWTGIIVHCALDKFLLDDEPSHRILLDFIRHVCIQDRLSFPPERLRRKKEENQDGNTLTLNE